MDQEDLKQLIEEKRAHLIELRKRIKNAQSIVPEIQKQIEITEWELEALTKSPDEAKKLIPDSLEKDLRREIEIIKEDLPMMPNYDPERIYFTSAVATSGSALMNDFIFKIEDLGTTEAKIYSEKFTSQYHALQESHNLPKEVRNIIEKILIPGSL